MKRTAVIGTLVASLLAGSAAMAGQGFHGNFDEHAARQDSHRNDRYDARRDDHDRNFRPAPSAPRYVYRQAPGRYGEYYAPRGYVARSWHRGDRLPAAYYARPYVVANYRDCGLRAPPFGYHWVRVNNDAVLAAVATGVVLDVAFHLFG